MTQTKKKINSVSSNYVTTNTQQNVTGLKVFNRPANGIIFKEETMDVNVVPTSEIQNLIKWQDKNAKDVGMVKSTHETGDWHRMELTATAQNSSGKNIFSMISTAIKPDGSVRTTCPSPASNSNDTSIATTAWVNSKISAEATARDTAISNAKTDINNTKVTTNTDQTISGAKTFSAVTKSATPASNSNDTSVATTAWVRSKITSSQYGPPNYNAPVNIAAGVTYTCPSNGWLLYMNDVYNTRSKGYLNGVKIFENAGQAGTWEDWNSLFIWAWEGNTCSITADAHICFWPCA